jgi:hypothetical protein
MLTVGLPTLLRRPKATLLRTAAAAARSTAFLAFYASCGWTFVALFRAAMESAPPPGQTLAEWSQSPHYHSAADQRIGFMAGAACGLAILLEQRSRRMEVALYVSVVLY